jgi:antibiotic biosynthesis monooxygenase (ABM) superfamily enzyme
MRTCCATKFFRASPRENISRYCGAEWFIRGDGNEVEFVTLLRFDSKEGVKEFAGADEARPVIYPGVEQLLTRIERSRHYRIAI